MKFRSLAGSPWSALASTRMLAAALPLLAFNACDGERETGGATCVPGQQVECACPGGAKGVQVCRNDGSGFDDCACAGGSAGTGGAGGGAGGGGAGGAGQDAAAGSGGRDIDASTPRNDAKNADDASEAGSSPDVQGHDATLDFSVDPTMNDALDETVVPPLSDAACVGAVVTVQSRQVDLYMMMDNSGSMDMIDTGQTISRWENLRQALPTFLDDPANAGMMVGADFFPEGGITASCIVSDYTLPNVPVDVIPGPNGMQSTAIINAVLGRTRSGGTPTVPALTGALQTAKGWQTMHPERSLGVLFLTDGQPTGCTGNTISGAAAVAQQYAVGIPPIRTYVLGVGPDTGNLDSIAAAGGTKAAFMVTNGGAAELAKALADIRKSAMTCGYGIPKVDGGPIDLQRVNVQIRLGTSGTSNLYAVGNAAGCADPTRNRAGTGWYYDNIVAPAQIILCPNSCTQVQTTAGSEVDIILGCGTRIPPPLN